MSDFDIDDDNGINSDAPATCPTRPRIEVLVGGIGIGKSTYARRRASGGWLVISHDDLTAMLHGQYRHESDLRGVYRSMEEALARVALLSGRSVVIDRTHLTAESRARWVGFRAAVVPRVPIVAVEFPLLEAADHAARRMIADPRGRGPVEWHFVARHHADQAALEPLDWRAEGFDGHIRIGLDYKVSATSGDVS